MNTYTKRELIDAMKYLDDDAEITISIIDDVQHGSESGFVYEIASFGMQGPKHGEVIGYMEE